MIPQSLPHLVASIPPPPSNSLTLGPLTFRYYGLMIALGVLAAVEIGRRRWAARGGDPEDIVEIAKWGVPAGLIGARLYHVITDWKLYTDDWFAAVKIWQGGLGIPGGLFLGIAVGVYVAKRRGMDLGAAVDAVVPGIPVAQAIGRLGNWFNQEIFGRPTDLPWALEVDEQFRPAEYAEFSTFHPTFLYEGLWNLGLAWALIAIDKKRVLRKGQILPLYMIGYGIGRFIVESMRTDAASLIWDIRVNHWVSGLSILIGLLWFAWLDRRPIETADADDTDDLDDTGDLDDTDDLEDTEPAAEELATASAAGRTERLFGNAKPAAESAELLGSEGEEITGSGSDRSE